MASFLTTASASFIILLLSTPSASAQLSPTFYSTTCPSALLVVRTIVIRAIAQERRMGASLLRLFFHDCFVNGCDASLLLDDTSSFQGEKMADANRDSVRGFQVIDDIKSLLELACPGVVSCADILAIAARDSVATLGGPSWPVALGRRDATTASLDKANRDIPDPNSSLTDLITKFADKGFSPQQMVALAGAHTIGQARCISFRDHIYNDTNIDSSFARTRKSSCPISSGSGDNNLAPLDLQTPTAFDNSYFRNLVKQMGLLHSDQELIDGGSTASLVHTYSSSPGKFASDFVAAIIMMGNISPLTGSQGQIRVNCRRINGD